VKLKDVFLGICIVALLASEVFLFSANQQKNAAQADLRDAKTQVEQLQKQLDELKNSDAESQNAEVAQLRAENQDLPRLRNRVTQLQAANQKLTQQLQTALDAGQQQQQQLQQLTTENQQAQAALTAAAQQAQTEAQTETAQRNVCIANLRQIDAAKQQWALENNKTASAVPAAQDLLPYFPNGFPVCPSGGTYTIGAVGVLPTCSIPGHTLSQ
jgi:chromosome segregation ATPase